MAESTETFETSSGELHTGTGYDLSWSKPGTDPALRQLDSWDDGVEKGLGGSNDSGSGDTYYTATEKGTDALAYARIRDFSRGTQAPVCAKLQDDDNYVGVVVQGTGSIGTRVMVADGGVEDDGDVQWQGAADQWIKVEADASGNIEGFSGGTGATPSWTSEGSHATTHHGSEGTQGLVCRTSTATTFGSADAIYYSVTFNDLGGGTAFSQSVSGSITPSGALARKTAKGVSGSVTAAGALVRKTAKGVSGSITAIGRVFKKTAQTLDGSVTPSGSLSSRVVIQQALSGSVTAAGNLARKTSKVFTGGITATGALARKTQKGLGGTVTATGTVVRKTARILAGSITASGALSTGFKSFQVLAGSVTATGSVVGNLIVGGAAIKDKFVGFIKNVGRGMMR